ncbi:MAG: DUF1501 domain-containing protein, partial [Dehalococcoidia bacterium]|nr:DUF1501 domain-containing protein [Dehalococcoidia bacterium]
MPWVVSAFLAVILCGAVFVVGRAARGAAAPGTPERIRGGIIMGAAAAVFVAWVGVHTALRSVKPIEAGHVGVVYQFGEIVGQKPEGLQFIWPWQDLRIESVQVQRYRFENITAFSQETQDVFFIATLNYSVSPSAVQTLYRTVGPRWFDRLIEPRVLNFFKEETVKYQTVDVGPNREKIRSAVRARLSQELAPFSIEINDLLIDNIEFSAEFKAAIEQKQIATQDALREQERVRQRQFEAQQQIELARGEAESIRVRAEGQAEANRLLAQSLTPEVIQFQALQKLGGAYPGKTEYPNTGFAKDLQLVAKLLSGGSGTRVYYTQIGGFDDHANEKEQHARVLKEVDGAIAAFYNDLSSLGLQDQVVTAVFSEFGRRVKENMTRPYQATKYYLLGAFLVAALAMILAGLAFKVSAAPFHMWTPDVYQGSPTPVVSFMAGATKAAAFAAILRVYVGAFDLYRVDWRPAVWVLAVVSLAVGSIAAVVQTDVKRMLAYSSVSHAGYVLI